MIQPSLFYQAALIDPPWLERGGGKIKRGADKHYDLVKTKDMPAVIRSCPYWGQMAEVSYLFMWVTNNFLKDGLWLMEELGYRYITNFVWTKDRIGLGQYARGQHELLLMGVRGKANRIRKKTAGSTWLGQGVIPRRAHSQKPDEQHPLVEHISPGPYLELFAREPQEGWTAWGDEIGPGRIMESYVSRTGTLKTLEALRAADWRLLVSPTGKVRHEGFPYCLDNGAWTAHQKGIPFDEGKFLRAIEKLGEGADFIAVPDIVCGGKTSKLHWILPLLETDCSVYVEPFCGSGSVLINRPRSPVEVYNDANEHIVTFFRVLRERPGELRRAIELTPYARREFQLSLNIDRLMDDLEVARRVYVRLAFGRMAKWRTSPGAWAAGRLGKGPDAHGRRNFDACAERLLGVTIECRDWLSVANKFDSRTTLTYLDPPYVRSGRFGWDKAYAGETSGELHARIVVWCLHAKGKVALSGYDEGQYDELDGWTVHRKEVAVRNGTGRKTTTRVECLWTNYQGENDDEA